MRETFPNERTPQDKKLAAWKKGPVFLASGSPYKLQGVKLLGMEHVSAVSVGEEVENEIFEHLQNHEDERVAMYIAEAKVRTLLATGVPDNALVCAFDTVAIGTRREDGKRVREHLQKPLTREEAHANLLEFFMNIADQKKWQDKFHAPLLAEARRSPHFDDVENSMRVGYPESLIVIATGMAARVPGGGDTIHAGIARAMLEPHSLYAFAQAGKIEQRKQFTEFANDALSIMDEGERWKKVTGGIDFSDPQIIGLLGIEELKLLRELPESEPGVFKGMPQEAFKKFLTVLAREDIG